MTFDSTTKAFHVSFVCTGNICRSPMAALVFGEHLRRAGLSDRVEVSSAGTGPWHAGESADPRTSAVLADHGYSTEHTAAQLDEHHLDADLLVAMDAGHLRVLRDEVQDADRVRLLRSFDPKSDEWAEVPDPYFGGERGFDGVMEMIEAAVPGLLDRVRAGLGLPAVGERSSASSAETTSPSEPAS
ncbi:protein-tyrosine phosphatase [Actinopolyspora mzabensis]|uniref:protein-tyrosine-phosphatase n=1 Tax=Actinopolyspora mzabensis TaxID=995066 RepID=A0A1G9DZJ4_ACTMZ|nr:low molecular weight protein-tyrosine-phosphatase [Actinopolyspora mzabensis]SDK69297.1 protein-tyrosine phosphatase [Actinopolyspora mzabensis]